MDTQRDSAALIGTRLGNYRLDSELGSGGMGTVYRATHEVLGRSAAVKLLRGNLMASPELVTRFINEAKAASAIQHPGIVKVFDFGHTDDGRAYLVMEFLTGESLSQRIARRGRLPAAEVARLARGIADALSAAHAKGIVHRDLKPDNIFVVPDPDLGERPKLLDFGIAKLGDLAPSVKYTQTGALMGTPMYMAPEQARAAGQIDRRADLYSLGCICYEMLVGTPPFTAEGAGEIIALHLFGKVEPPGASAELDAIVMRLLEKEPAHRFQHAAEVTAALDRIEMGSDPISMVSESPRPAPIAMPTLDERPPQRSKLPLIAVAIMLLVGALAVGLFVMLRGDEPPKIEQPIAAPQPAPAPPPVAVEPPPPAPVAEPAGTAPAGTTPAGTTPLANVKQPTPVKKRPTTIKGSPIENEID